MRRVVGHDGALSSPLLSLGGAGQAGGGFGAAGIAGMGFLKRTIRPRDVPGSPTTGYIPGIFTVLNSDGTGKLITTSETSGGNIVIYDIQNWDDFSDPVNSVISYAPISPGGGVRISLADDGQHMVLNLSSHCRIYNLPTPWDLTTAVQIPLINLSHSCVAPDGSFMLRILTDGSNPYVTTLHKWDATAPWDFSDADAASPDQSQHIPELWNNGGYGIEMPMQDLVITGNRAGTSTGYGGKTFSFTAPGDISSLQYHGQLMLADLSGQTAFAPGRVLNAYPGREYLYELM
ncbi:hypothetical protein PhaeoP23_01754 [Phaeobacter piscinae]|uniref:Uncharacterized protein n=1 Tax=Phaeobacter piscinae TaxID=1580596 RepID=A0ABM6PE01_9RHOB|nr:hypothetical protein [Phaeobacter piscinae]ATG35896.1 hypothetical protein PhaeoP36_01754 [Phaeobacter piscinae]AUQ86417.1 hypothetical protein PhaeoP42_01755 [Phaeobacter piscinae]AUR24300.1 hypothetical protein PhaeoP23_01754 [Phaeobacter piscinae]